MEHQPNFSNHSPARNNALIAYAFMLLGFLTGVFWLVGGIWAYIKRQQAPDEPWSSHYKNIMTVFWWGLALFTISILTWVFFIGILLFFITAVWSLYRLIKGLALLTDDKPYA